MSQELNSPRRRFLSTAGRALLAAPFGLAGMAWQRTQAAARSPFPTALASLDHASQWLNSAPLKAADMQGKVVLIDFWTYTCINWLRTAPYVRAWAEQYREQGLTVIGVHAPEFPFEHNLDNVRRATKDLGVSYPIAIDNDFTIWRAFRNQYWPALYFLDAHGRIRHQQFGEGGYEQSERLIQQLLQEAGSNPGPERAIVQAQGLQAAADWSSLQSAENYVGYGRTTRFASPGGIRPDVRYTYVAPNGLTLNQWALSGDWTMKQGNVVLNKAGGSITYRFHARDLHLVMAPATPGVPARFRVRIDGAAPGAARGLDVNEQGNGTVTQPRLYQLVRQPKTVVDRLFEIEFPDAGVEAFAFTFG